jgi:hypothetical protein
VKVFISWSGSKSKAVAALLRDELPAIVRAIKPFMSQHDILSGERWAKEIAQELDHTSFGVFCLTSENIGAPWLHFEAGALSKLEGRVAGLLIGGLKPADFNNPLSQFQHRYFNKEDIHKLVSDISIAANDDLVSVHKVLEKMWPDIEQKYREILAIEPELNAPNKRDQEELLEELLLRQRNFDSLIAEVYMKVNSLLPAQDNFSNQEIYLNVIYSSSKPIDIAALNELVYGHVAGTNKYLHITCNEDTLNYSENKNLKYTVFAKHFPNSETIRQNFKNDLEQALMIFAQTFPDLNLTVHTVYMAGYKVQDD